MIKKWLTVVSQKVIGKEGNIKLTDSGIAKPGPTQVLTRASAHQVLASEIDDHVINLYSLQPASGIAT